MKCPKCQAINEATAQFCEECGATLQKAAKSILQTCASCNEPYNAGDAYCQNCGQVLTEKRPQKNKAVRGGVTSRDERYRLARQLAAHKMHKGNAPEPAAALTIYIGEKIL